MKKICRNCGAKVPKKSDICKKCGEPYEYIDLIRLDPEAEKALQIDKPSVMNNVCVLILSVLVFAYSLFLIYPFNRKFFIFIQSLSYLSFTF